LRRTLFNINFWTKTSVCIMSLNQFPPFLTGPLFRLKHYGLFATNTFWKKVHLFGLQPQPQNQVFSTTNYQNRLIYTLRWFLEWFLHNEVHMSASTSPPFATLSLLPPRSRASRPPRADAEEAWAGGGARPLEGSMRRRSVRRSRTRRATMVEQGEVELKGAARRAPFPCSLDDGR
jgi:hypothetical protein